MKILKTKTMVLKRKFPKNESEKGANLNKN